MTKVWDDVKQEACRLYLRGATLSQVQNELRNKYNFKASARSFRLKFKEWGVTRASQLRELQAHDRGSMRHSSDRTTGPTLAFPAPEIQVIPDRALSEPLESTTITPFSRSPITPTATLAPSPLSARMERDHLMLLSPGSARSRGRSPSYFDPALETGYDKLQQAQSGDEIARILTSLPFVPGEDTILHLAAARTEHWTLDYILDYMRVIRLVVDIEGSRRQTALEYAIRADQVGAVEALLEGGASVIRRNEAEQMPLHLAVQTDASVEIVNLLLQYGADPEAPLSRSRGLASIPVYLAFERLQSSRSHHAKESLCVIVELLLQYRINSLPTDSGDEPSMMAFLESWTRWESHNTLARWERPGRQFRLSHFLRNECNPLSWIPRSYCPGRECNSLASFVFAHTSSSGLSELLVESTDVSKHSRSLLYCLLAPCSQRIHSATESSTYELVNELLRRMTWKGVIPPEEDSILHQILGHSPESERLTLIRLVHSWGLLTVKESRVVLMELSRFDAEFRLLLTEILLSLPDLAPSAFWTDLMVQNFTRTGRMYIRQRAFSEQTRLEFQDTTLRKLEIDPGKVSSADSICLIQCVIHYWTKKLLEGDTFNYEVSNQQRVFGAVQSRQEYDLPPLPIPGDLVLSIFPHLDHRSRGNTVASSSARADAMNSPRSTLPGDASDGLGVGAYPSPYSLSSLR